MSQVTTSRGYCRRFNFLTFWWRSVNNHGIGRAHLPRERDGFLHSVDVKQSGSAWNNDECRRLDSFDDAH